MGPNLIVLLIVVAVIAINYIVLRQRVEKLKALSAVFDGRAFIKFFVPTFVGRYDASEFIVRLISGGKNRPPSLEVQVVTALDLRMTVRPESQGAAFLKTLRLVKDVQIGDPLFDERFIVSASDDMGAQRYFASAEKKDALRAILELGWHSITFSECVVTAHKVRYGDSDITPEAITAAVRLLGTLARPY